MQSIPIGAKGSFEAVVRREDLANTFKDASLPPVLSTPVMIKFMENAALRAIQPYLDGNETAVGTEVSVRHLAATPGGRNGLRARNRRGIARAQGRGSCPLGTPHR